jgi:hypothetical protein
MTRNSGAWVALAALLVAYLVATATRNFPNQIASDLYHPWGIAAARDAVPPPPGNPYANTAAYGAILEGIAAAGDSIKAKLSADFWQLRSPAARIEPTGTPFFYAALGFLPRDFGRAHLLHALLQFACVGTSVFLLARLRGALPAPALCLAAFVLATYNAFVQEVKMGNVNSMQLLVLVGLLHAAVTRRYLARPALEYGLLAMLGAFVVFKPNTALIAAAFLAHYGIVRGPRRLAGGAAVAGLGALACVGIGAAYFGSAAVWHDWYRYTQGLNGGTLLYNLDAGNQSVAMLMAERSGAYGAMGNGMILAAAFVTAFAVAMTQLGKRPELLKPLALELLADPWFALSLGVVFTYVASPLLWPHYFLFALIPIAMLVRSEGRWDRITACALASYFALFLPLVQAVVAMKLVGLAHAMLFFNWLPLVPALLAYVVRQRRRMEAA